MLYKNDDKIANLSYLKEKQMIKVLKEGNRPYYTTVCEKCGAELRFNESDVDRDVIGENIKCAHCKLITGLNAIWREEKKFDK